METDLLDLASSALWMLSIFMELVAAALCVLRGKYLLSVGFGTLFAVDAFNWLFTTFLADLLMSSTALDMGAIYQWRSLLMGMLYIGAWLVVCAGLFTALKPAAEFDA
jgi:hypothetical protein